MPAEDLEFQYELRGPGPYRARSASNSTDDWALWYVTTVADGRSNILSFPDKPGAVFADRSTCELIAAHENMMMGQRKLLGL
jgi:hypothetical protein